LRIFDLIGFLEPLESESLLIMHQYIWYSYPFEIVTFRIHCTLEPVSLE